MRSPKPPRPTSEQLAAALRDNNRYHRKDVFYAYSLYKPELVDLPILREALRNPELEVTNWAAISIGKLGPQCAEAVEDLISALTAPWENGCPQCFCESIAALVRINPSDPRLVAIIQAALPCSNYGIFKAGVEALASIGTPEAFDTIKWIDKFWGTGRKEKIEDDFIHKTLVRCGRAPAAGSTPVFVEHRGALFQKLEGSIFRTSVYCPSCRRPMTSLKGAVPYQCRKCGVKLDFNGSQLEAVMTNLR